MFFEWWNGLSTAAHVFYCMAIPATVLLLIQTVMMFLGFGDDADGADVDVGADASDIDIPDDVEVDVDLPDASDGVFGENTVVEGHDAFGIDGLRVFTLRGIIAFFVVFGWVGVAMDAAGVHLGITIAVATVSGFAMMLALAFLLKAVMKLRSDGNADNRNAVGMSGKVYLTIPPARSGEGKVQVMLQGAYVERNAVTDDDQAIPTGAEIVVVGVSGVTDLVVRRK